MRRVLQFRHLRLHTFFRLIIFVYGVSSFRLQYFMATDPTDFKVRDRINYSAEKKSDSAIDCGRICASDEKCKFFEYNKETKMCHVASGTGTLEKIYFKYRACPADKGYFLWIFNDMTLCVMHSTTKLNYSDSLAFCKKDNGHHFLIENSAMRTHLIEILAEREATEFIWLDGFDADGVDQFLTWKGAPLPWQVWTNGNPNHGGEDCVEAVAADGFGLRDTYCRNSRQIVCQLDMY